MKRIAILGSTGSIGQNTLNVIRAFPERFKVVALAAGSNLEEMKCQANEWKPLWICLAEKQSADTISSGIPAGTKILMGIEGMIEIVQKKEVDFVVFATTGNWGLTPLLAAIKARKKIALANKESLVMAGRIVTESAKKEGVVILPIDSEHNAIFQILNSNSYCSYHRIFLTCSGGPFLHVLKEQLETVTVQQALSHPRWKMGRKITVDSSTLMNKGLEIIEAKWLFGASPDQIEVVIHPETIIHSMVEFVDGSLIAQMGVTDMKGPIQYALAYPDRFTATTARLNLMELGQLTFMAPDMGRFPCLKIAYQVAKSEESHSVVMNAVNDTVVSAFLNEQIRWIDIPLIIETVLSHHQSLANPDLEQILQLDQWARQEATRMIALLTGEQVHGYRVHSQTR